MDWDIPHYPSVKQKSDIGRDKITSQAQLFDSKTWRFQWVVCIRSYIGIATHSRSFPLHFHCSPASLPRICWEISNQFIIMSQLLFLAHLNHIPYWSHQNGANSVSHTHICWFDWVVYLVTKVMSKQNVYICIHTIQQLIKNEWEKKWHVALHAVWSK